MVLRIVIFQEYHKIIKETADSTTESKFYWIKPRFQTFCRKPFLCANLLFPYAIIKSMRTRVICNLSKIIVWKEERVIIASQRKQQCVLFIEYDLNNNLRRCACVCACIYIYQGWCDSFERMQILPALIVYRLRACNSSVRSRMNINKYRESGIKQWRLLKRTRIHYVL